MSKLTKFINTPGLFFKDAIRKRIGTLSDEKENSISNAQEEIINPDLIPTYVFGLSPWKQFLHDWFPERHLVFLPKTLSEADFRKKWAQKVLRDSRSQIFVWGFKVEPYLLEFVKQNNVGIYYIEDGFIRSVGLGATKTPPFSLSMDTQTPYFNAQMPSDLESLLNTYDFKSDPELMERSARFMDVLLKSGISKYNHAKKVDITTVYGEKTTKRVLVVGQVEDDASIMFGCARRYTNNDAVTIAALENPGAQIIYKPHPDVLNGHRPMQSNPEDVKHLCQVLVQDIPLAQAFETIDHVYTITSQAGFEALMRGIHVTTLGCPFYAGWGLTDERQPNPRRQRQLTLAEVFAAAYVLYPRYFDPIYKKPLTAEEALERLIQLKSFSDSRVTAEANEQEAVTDEIASDQVSIMVTQNELVLAIEKLETLRLQLAEQQGKVNVMMATLLLESVKK